MKFLISYFLFTLGFLKILNSHKTCSVLTPSRNLQIVKVRVNPLNNYGLVTAALTDLPPSFMSIVQELFTKSCSDVEVNIGETDEI